jgi:hypothetical protein
MNLEYEFLAHIFVTRPMATFGVTVMISFLFLFSKKLWKTKKNSLPRPVIYNIKGLYLCIYQGSSSGFVSKTKKALPFLIYFGVIFSLHAFHFMKDSFEGDVILIRGYSFFASSYATMIAVLCVMFFNIKRVFLFLLIVFLVFPVVAQLFEFWAGW